MESLWCFRIIRAETVLAGVWATVAAVSSAVLTALVAGAFMVCNTLLLWWLQRNDRRHEREEDARHEREEREALRLANSHGKRRRRASGP